MSGARGPALRWAARAVAPGARVVDVRSLRSGAGPWLVRFGDPDRAAVLRLAAPDDRGARERLATEAAALDLAGRHALPTPRLIAAELDGAASGRPALLTTVLPGSSRIPATPSPERMRALGRAAAALHAVTAEPGPDLPLRRWPMDGAGGGFTTAWHGTSPLLVEARERVGGAPGPEPAVFVHADLWQGNALWVGDSFSGFVDWEYGGVGSAGVDLGNLRCDAALLGDPAAPGHVLDGWESVAGPARDLARWDVVAALSTPADVATWLPAIHGQGRADLTAGVVAARRDAFLRGALDRFG
ncbi:aminoglycoside phosphotransferase family protein [Saccharothrix lopnurensis]|uniref:Aminoglycoside phosphotransferase family protein n=1 Tax=Saccharothrix lopnurensis TaxID=1670621 RepID=A0ABW1PGB2_9PSEU